jgi:hypothetical protein
MFLQLSQVSGADDATIQIEIAGLSLIERLIAAGNYDKYDPTSVQRMKAAWESIGADEMTLIADENPPMRDLLAQNIRPESFQRLRRTPVIVGLVCVYLLAVMTWVVKARLAWFQVMKAALIAGFTSTLVGACLIQIGNASLTSGNLAWSLMWVGYFQFCALLMIVIPAYFFSERYLGRLAMWQKGMIGLTFGFCGFAVLHGLLSSLEGGLLAAGASGIIYGIFAPPWKK